MRSILFSLLILLASAQAFAANEVKFDLCGPKTDASGIGTACKQGSIHFDGISRIETSNEISTRVEISAYARLPVANGPEPIVSTVDFKVLFDNPNEARAFVQLVRSGAVSRLVGVGRYTPMDALTYSLGPVKLDAKHVFFIRAK